MVAWQAFVEAAPGLASSGAERIEKHGLILLGTTRKDGTARISAVEAYLVDGQLCLGMMWRSKKALDLLRDPRCVVHNVVVDKEATEGEFKLRGRAAEVSDQDARERFAEAVFAKLGWRPPEPYHLFAIDIESVAAISFAGGEMKLQHWPG